MSFGREFALGRHAMSATQSVKLAAFVAVVAVIPWTPAAAPLPHFEFGVASEIADDGALARYYAQRGFRPIWTGAAEGDRQRLDTFLRSLESAPSHGLPFGEVQIDELRSLLSSANNPADLASAEVRTTRLYLEYASALTAGAVDPKSVHQLISRNKQKPALEYLLDGILSGDPEGFMMRLAPATTSYTGLRKKLRELEAIAAAGGWGSQVEANEVGSDASGPQVVHLRNRLIRMGYLKNSASAEFGDALYFAIKRFQTDHGLDPDGEADSATIREVNIEPDERRRQVIAALERSRWMNFPMGDQFILVNLPDYRASVIRDGKEVYGTRVVVGKSRLNLQTPEFSDEMTHVIVNPTWWVPRSISTTEVLPKLKEDPFAEPQLVIFDPEDGTPVDRLLIDFSKFDRNSFPFEMRQSPGPDNALGQVKFMFPNQFNVYMHDTPWKALFQQEARSFSHGCIRVHHANDFALFLLGMQYEDPAHLYESLVTAGAETRVNLENPLPVHITYQTAWVAPGGKINYRRDMYGRDALIYEQLVNAGLDTGFPSN